MTSYQNDNDCLMEATNLSKKEFFKRCQFFLLQQLKNIPIADVIFKFCKDKKKPILS